MKQLFLTLLTIIAFTTASAQNKGAQDPDASHPGKNKTRHIIFQLTSDDTLSHKALMKQLNNLSTVDPTAKIEVVCHGPGLGMLVAEKTTVRDKIQKLKSRGIEFVACEFAMSERSLSKDKMIPEAGFVKYGIIEIVSKQEEGWSYIKSGF